MSEIAKHIKSVAEDEAVRAICGDRVYPIVVPAGVPIFPFAVFQSSDVETEDTKDGDFYDTTQTEFVCVSKKYEEASKLASAIRRALKKHARVEYDDFEVQNTLYMGSEEEYKEDIAAYMIYMKFNFEVSFNF